MVLSSVLFILIKLVTFEGSLAIARFNERYEGEGRCKNF